MTQPILVTGAAGFIGAAVSERLLARGEIVVGIDNLNDYYSQELKRSRLERIKHGNFNFKEQDISDEAEMEKLFATIKPKA